MLGDTNFAPRVTRTRLVRSDRWDYERVRAEPKDGPAFERDIIRHPGAVIILPVLAGPQGPSIVLIRNWRLSLETWLWELPAGTLEPGEDPREAAPRELAEETGYHAATWAPLCRFHTSPGLSDEVMHAFVASDLAPGPTNLQPDERASVHVRSWTDTLALIDRGELTDAKSILVIQWALRSGALGAR